MFLIEGLQNGKSHEDTQQVSSSRICLIPLVPFPWIDVGLGKTGLVPGFQAMLRVKAEGKIMDEKRH